MTVELRERAPKTEDKGLTKDDFLTAVAGLRGENLLSPDELRRLARLIAVDPEELMVACGYPHGEELLRRIAHVHVLVGNHRTPNELLEYKKERVRQFHYEDEICPPGPHDRGTCHE